MADRIYLDHHASAPLVTAEADEVQARIDDAPFDECINENVFLLSGDETVRLRGIQREDALVEKDHVLEGRRQLEVQTGAGDNFLDFTEGKHHGVLTLIDDEKHRRSQAQRNKEAKKNGGESVHGWLSSATRSATGIAFATAQAVTRHGRRHGGILTSGLLRRIRRR